MALIAIRADFLHCLSDPGIDGSNAAAIEHVRDGMLLIRDGRIERLGPADSGRVFAWDGSDVPA